MRRGTPAYLPYPRFLLKMEISQTAKLLYSLLLDRSTLSQKNKWLDDEGRIYGILPHQINFPGSRAQQTIKMTH